MPDEKKGNKKRIPTLEDLAKGRAAWPSRELPDRDHLVRAFGDGRVLKWGIIPLGGRGGTRFKHFIGHKRYFPMVSVLARPTDDVGDIYFELHGMFVTVINTGPGLGQAMIVLMDLTDAPQVQ